MILSPHPSAGNILFDASTHTYTLDKDTDLKFTSGTTFISKFFNKFNAKEISEKYALKHGLIAEEVREAWETKGRKASERGTLYHKYAEDCFYNRNIQILDNVHRNI